MSVIDELIFDRTGEDVANLTKKGFYNASDLNRVGEAVQYISDTLHGYGYAVEVSPKTDWSMTDIPRKSQMDQYVRDVAALRAAISVYTSTPTAPPNMEKLTWQKANDIKKILFDLDEIITKMSAAWFYSGDLYAGEV